MKRFSSPLLPVQQFHAARRQTAALQLATAIQVLSATKVALCALDQQYDASYADSRWEQFSTIYWAHQYRAHLRYRRVVLEERQRTEQECVEQCRRHYREAYLTHRTFQLLIERKQATHLKKQHRVAEDYADDIGRHLIYKR